MDKLFQSMPIYLPKLSIDFYRNERKIDTKGKVDRNTSCTDLNPKIDPHSLKVTSVLDNRKSI